MKVAIIVELDGDENADPEHEMGITNDAYDRLTSYTEHGSPPLLWLGEVADVEKVPA